MNTRIKNFIKNHAKDSFPNECCGFIVEKNGKIDCIKCDNVAINKEQDFQIKVDDYLNIKDQYNILYVYHSHTNDNENFSDTDKMYSDEMALNYLMYHLKTDQFKIHESDNLLYKYVGRYFEYRKYDCFTLIKDFFKNELKIDLNYDQNIIQNETLQNINILDEVNKFYSKNNLIKIEDQNSLIKNDLLLINGFKYGSHFAVYLGEDKILHHPMNSFSKVDNYCNFYKRNTVAVLRRS